MSSIKTKYRRILLKLSGEAFKGNREYGIDPKFLGYLAAEINEIHAIGVEICIVIGGGNIFRGLSASANGMNRVTGDYMGMIATIMNALALQDALKKSGIETRVLSSLEIPQVSEPFILNRALSHLKKGYINIFSGGTGNPFFTTDTTAALRAAEIRADVVLKATKVNGIYSSDPHVNKEAVRYETVSYLDVINLGLKVMDSTAISLCMDNGIPIIVFNINNHGSLKSILTGKCVGTIIK